MILLLLGCGVDLTQFVPTVRFNRMDVKAIDFEHIDTDFVFDVDNPNPVGAPVDRFDYAFSLMGVDIVSGDDPNGLELVAGGSSEVALPIGLVFDDVYDAITATRGEDYVDFGFKGGIGVDTDAGPIDVNFDEQGSFPALRMPKINLGQFKINGTSGTSIDMGLDIDLDNDQGSNMDFADVAFDMEVAGVNIGNGALAETVTVEGATSKRITLPITVDILDAGAAAADILAGNPVNLKLDLSSNVDTPFGVLPLHVDQSGRVNIE